MLGKKLLVSVLVMWVAPLALAQLSPTDKTFVMKTAKVNNYEIKAARLAQSKTSNDTYKQYAQ